MENHYLSWVNQLYMIVMTLEHAIYFQDNWEYILTSKMLEVEMAIGLLHQE